MNATDTPRDQRRDDNRPSAVQRATVGAVAWRAVVHAQQSTNPDHADFYALAAELVDTLRSLDALAGLLAQQVAGYSNGREVYDDEGANPAHRLRCGVLVLAEARAGLSAAERATNRFWSAIGHIGLRYPNGGDRS